ncbi:MAG TPA: hypothetical protein VIG40_07760 [Tissierellaceae bacterium]
MSQDRNGLIQLASSKQQQQRLTKVTTLDDQTVASYTYDENGLRLTKTIGDTTHEYFYNDEVLEMEVVKVKDVVTEYRSYEWNGNPVMNVDPNGEKSWKIVRKYVLANTITTIIGLGVGFHGIYTLARMLKTYTKAKVVQLKLVTYITKMGIYRNLAVTIASTLVNSIINIAGSSIGGVAVWVLSRYFKTVTKYAKKYVYWGSKVKVEYLDFGKRR